MELIKVFQQKKEIKSTQRVWEISSQAAALQK